MLSKQTVNTGKFIQKSTLVGAVFVFLVSAPGINAVRRSTVVPAIVENVSAEVSSPAVTQPEQVNGPESEAVDFVSFDAPDVSPSSAYAFGNPAGCSASNPNITPEQMLANVQNAIGDAYDLAERRQTYVWNGEMGTMLNVMDDPFVFEFVFNDFQHPLTYRGDKVATIFLTNGFVVWFRQYGGNFRLTAIPMVEGVLESRWGSYVTTYWQPGGAPNDEHIYPVMKKLPCHWVVDAGYVTNETLHAMFDLNPAMPDYLSAGRKYLAGTCKDANRISREVIGYWDASSMCGPLAWTIINDVNGFPYRIGSWSKDAGAFTSANPRWNGQPWGSFDPETFTLIHSDKPMPRYPFEENGNLYPGDIVYSFASLYAKAGYFDHIFVVAGIDEDGTRLSVSNMVRNAPYADCSIEEIRLYTPGDLDNGVVNHEWNGFNFGKTGTTGFDIFRWNWITYHLEGLPMTYTVRWGDTLDTIAFDWKISTESLVEANQISNDMQLTPGQVITLPAPPTSERG